MDILSSAVLGLVQGLTEFAPVSSSGHLVLFHEIFGSGAGDLAFDALLHLATALAIIRYFWRDITVLVRDFVHGGNNRTFIWSLGVATIPAIVIGLLLEDIMATAFRNPLLVAGALVMGSSIMYLAELFFKERRVAQELSWKQAFSIGLFQSLALIPGISRSGMTISGGMFFGLSRAESARFGFLLGVPIFLGAGTKKLVELYTTGALSLIGSEAFVGALVAFVSGILVIHFLLSFLRTYSLRTFIVYRLILALAIVLVVLL